ncbi:UDP-glucose flavonoid 3-O-glucosyltransferase 6-like protein [Trifolium pratense]|uniref:Glycosyltransferase n=1 Tax=Trifolium pratense TaxID=57577 RepID=A0A2K3NSQ6_TRIPR|nr:UDP-glucose flavonoid 3-O-glucosyltransferase 6-like protein [Trifolium pratense]
MKKAQVVFIPFPVPSHLVSTLEFAKLLINHDNRLRITILLIKFPHTTETDVYTKSLPISDSLNFINLPECSLPPDTKPNLAMHALIEAQKPNIKQTVSDLTAGEGQHGHLAAFVVDMFCTNMIDIAKEFSVPTLVFSTSGVASLGLNLYLHTLREKVDLNQLLKHTEFSIPSFANSVPSYSLPGSVLNKEWEMFFMSYCRGLKNADGIIVNSFEELESYAVQSFYSHPELASLPIIYPVGPILNPEPKTKGTVDSDDIIKWLDDQPPSSVVFLCFGSMGSFDEDQVKEIAHAVENSGARFVWALRKPKPKGVMPAPTDYPLSELLSILPEGFLDRTAEIGKVIGWAPQTQILAHPATGGFVSHCGWNSTLESIYFGVPIATWPLFAEQQTNAFELVHELKIGVEIALDYKVDFNGGPNYLVTADKIEKGITNVLDTDGEVRKNMKEMSEKSKKTLSEGGSSYTYLGRLIDYIMNQV